MVQNTAVFEDQISAYERRMKAEEDAAAARSPIFTYSELGLDDPSEFHNFMDPPATG
ncbi:hypothetical protein A2U01_0110191 [Trifolium medium]|uniref:Uncharacterized protein n=1 Tax=Trifolium medium TaxID=97028 RepID=A0A392VN48_9FABA|nr:hypothetical protein [Trifolium medium]